MLQQVLKVMVYIRGLSAVLRCPKEPDKINVYPSWVRIGEDGITLILKCSEIIVHLFLYKVMFNVLSETHSVFVFTASFNILVFLPNGNKMSAFPFENSQIVINNVCSMVDKENLMRSQARLSWETS